MIYDVFLILRTRYPSISSLQFSLRFAGIKIFIDENEEITPTLMETIDRSKIVIVVFTDQCFLFRDFVCKLQKIKECHKNKDKTVLGVYCGLSPMEARAQSGRFADGLPTHKALASKGGFLWGAPLFGWKVSTSGDTNMIRKITQYVKKELDKTYSDISKGLPGIQLRVNEVLHLTDYYTKYPSEKELHLTDYYTKCYSKDIVPLENKMTIVGIWGIGGIGKTTLARAIYDTIGGSFESRSFLEHIQNVSEKANGLVSLQEQLLSDVSLTKHEKILDIKKGVSQMKKVLNNKRALVVLDDISQTNQLTALCGNGKCFSDGSMILITTRNKHILDELNVKYVFEMKRIDNSQSLELFSWNAFKHSNPRDGFINLAKSMVTYCEGLPLVLEVLGSLLFKKTKPVWKSVLMKLKGIPAGQIQEKLKISCEYLDASVKDLFFNIACFYVGEEKQDVVQKLNGFKIPADTGISTLIEQSLVKTDMNNKLYMHELLQDIGKGINPKKPKSKYVYDVFLSFRGEDTRKSFTTHLHVALKNEGIKTFMDNGIRRGENISFTLRQAIENSRMSIVVFSINYSGSRWCLQELEKIMECHRNTCQEVLPIFYGIQPSDVRKQLGSFGKALEGLVKKTSANKEKEFSWTRALNDAANISGRVSGHHGTDAELIDHVIEDVTMKLYHNTDLLVAHHPVGVNCRMQEIIQMLSDKSNEIMIAGIFGMGGIGKSTIAKAIFNEICQSFEAKSFLTNIRKAWDEENGQVLLQEQLLSDILQTKKITLHSVELGKAIIKERLCHKKALIVLDDVNNVVQLNVLCGSREWFGPGSRIIVTTRDEHVLRILQADNVYSLKEMDENESLELFSWHAFKQENPKEDFNELSRRVIAYSEGLPLALEILGSYLFDRPVKAWESVLDRLKALPDDKIQKKLKISYDGLSNDEEKEIFLDICCFFIGRDRNYTTQILDGCGLHAEIGITRLIELSLIKVDRNNKLDMHGLLRDMGREIIREMSAHEPENRTRLWSYNDVVEVLTHHMGTRSVKGLALNLSKTKMLSFDAIAFKMMTRLRLLQLGHVKLDGNYEYLSKELRWLCWHGFPLKCLPENFHLENAIAIDLKYSHLTHVLKGGQLLAVLKILNLSHSYYLRRTPDFSQFPNLERLILKDCPRLSSIHQSIGDLKYLILLNLKNCKDLTDLPSSLCNLKSLEILDLFGCSKIYKLEGGFEQMESLTTLLANGTAIMEVPRSLVRSRSIKYVSLCGYEGLPEGLFSPLIWSWTSPTNSRRFLNQAFASMPFLLQNLFHTLPKQNSGNLETGQSTIRISRAKSPALIGLYDQVHKATPESFTSSLTIQVGGFNEVIDTLSKRISEELANGGLDYSLPGDNYPDWLAFENEGSKVSFKVPQVVGCYLKGMVIYIIYSSLQDYTSSLNPIVIMLKNFTKTTMELYKRDATTTSADENWLNIISNLETGNEVDFTVDFLHKCIVKKTAIYLVYGRETNKVSGLSITE